MDGYLLVITLIGLAALGMSWMPALTEYTGIPYSILYVGIGAVLYLIFPATLPRPDPVMNGTVTMRLAEMVVIISLMGTGIKIDRVFTLKKWRSPLRLLSVAMLLCIAATAFAGTTFLRLNIAAALLLGAVIAPTDPVLASGVQVGPPNEGKRSETKFALTAEAGLNDGLAFPFVWLAITFAVSNQLQASTLLSWLAYDVLYKIATGLAIGFLFGKAIGYILFKAADKYPALKTREGFLAISLTLLVYGSTELIHGYGFIAVFICAITLRHFEKHHHYHDTLHTTAEQTEKLFVAILLILFGGSLVSGILSPLTWKMVAFSFLFLFIIRPAAAYISLFLIKMHTKEKLAISFFGIRGMGSIYYLAFALTQANFAHAEELWATVAFTVLISIFIHGCTAAHAMKKLADIPPAQKKAS